MATSSPFSSVVPWYRSGVSDSQRTALLRAEMTRLEAEIVVLDRQWRQKHWLGLIGLSAVPLAILGFEPLWIAIALLGGPSLVATQAYLLYVRRRECRDLIAQAQLDIERVIARASSPRTSSPTEGASDRADRSDARSRTPR